MNSHISEYEGYDSKLNLVPELGAPLLWNITPKNCILIVPTIHVKKRVTILES